MKSIKLKRGKEIAVLRRHPWVFSGAIHEKEEGIEEGEIIRIVSFENKFLGIAHYQNSSIAARIFTFRDDVISEQFWCNRIHSAFQYRIDLGLLNGDNNCFRLVFGESDLMPGLVLDYYGGNIVFQAHSIGMHKLSGVITQALKSVLGDRLKTIYDKSKESLPGGYASGINNSFLFGNNSGAIVLENGNKFHVDWVNGQKTGFFLDQRDNRKLLAHYSVGKKVLNTFCYTGGFSVYAGMAGAAMVHSVDSSKRAIELTEKNILENNITSHQGICMDAFDFLKNDLSDYDVIVLDPPAFAKHREVKHKAVIGYKNLNYSTLKRMKAGSTLFTFSCTQVVDKILFFNTVTAAAIESGREIRILHYLHQPADHPINPLHPEGEYLKGMVIKIIN